MRIHSHIFISVFLAALVPLIALALAASYYNESTYQRETQREIIASLNGASIEISHELQNSRNLVLGISRANAIKSFTPILKSIAAEENHPSVRLLRRKINRYFEGFQTIISGNFVLRVLDINGDTLVKVTDKKTSQAQFESLQGIKYVEHQISTPAFIQSLEKLPADEVSFLSLPHHSLDNDVKKQLLDYAVPLYDEKTWLGTLVVTFSGEQIDRILNNVTRLYKGRLLVFENNPDNIARHSMVLYDDLNKLHVAQNRLSPRTLSSKLSEALLKETIQNAEGAIENQNKRIYYSEFFPYQIGRAHV